MNLWPVPRREKAFDARARTRSTTFFPMPCLPWRIRRTKPRRGIVDGRCSSKPFSPDCGFQTEASFQTYPLRNSAPWTMIFKIMGYKLRTIIFLFKISIWFFFDSIIKLVEIIIAWGFQTPFFFFFNRSELYN